MNAFIPLSVTILLLSRFIIQNQDNSWYDYLTQYILFFFFTLFICLFSKYKINIAKILYKNKHR